MYLETNPDNPQPRHIEEAAATLRRGGIICYPTDTMYGIGCDIFNQKAVKRIHQLKRRPKHKPFSFMCPDLKHISDYAHVSNTAYRCMRKCLPGPYTFVLAGTKLVPKIMLTKQKTVGIRVPDNAICLALLAAVGHPILTTSAVGGEDEEPPTHAWEVQERFGDQVDLYLDGGPVFPDPSTVVSLIDGPPEILRYGKGDPSLFE